MFEHEYGAPLHPKAKAFIDLLNYYLVCGEKKRGLIKSTVHASYTLMSRSDFCSIYNKLLPDEAREQVYAVICRDKANPVDSSMFLNALDKNENEPIFTYPYYSKTYETEAGSKIIDWFDSILKTPAQPCQFLDNVI